ncbi:hypothetical protein BDW74DRAFT_169327 [Aspergillus multicolor]|uniref:uncharacterized protein n=1 Tax=Aspergillus multicolor TaxID=41759 RepID=UPI003CCD6ED8
MDPRSGPPAVGPLPPRQKATTACSYCRRQKIKCSGQQPCYQCVANDVECTLDPTTDQRRTTDLKRKLVDLEENNDLLRRLLRTLRHKNAYPTVGEIKSFMNGTMTRQRVDKTPELLEVYEEVDRLHRIPVTAKDTNWALDTNRLCHTPVYSVPAHPWTAITTDDEFVSHLVSAWFCWHHSLFDWIDRDLFLQDMKSGKLGSTFCSPFVVNAMLADACRLLEAEEDQITLSYVYGMGTMFSSTAHIGKDRLGWWYLVRASEAFRMLKARQDEMFAGVDVPQESLTRAMNRLEPGLFCVSTMTANAFLKPPPLDKPIGITLPSQHDDPVLGHKNCVLNECARLSKIVWDITQFLTDADHEGKHPRADMEVAVQEWHQELNDWITDLPSCLVLSDQAIPSVLDLHMYRHSMILTIYVFLKTPPPDADPTTLSSVAAARQVCIDSTHAVRDLVAIHESRWGLSRMSTTDMHFISIASQMLIDDLSNEKSYAAFLTLCRAALSAGRAISTLQASPPLPQDIILLFEDFECRIWKPEDKQQYSSLFPHFATAIKQREKAAGDGLMDDESDMDRVLEAWGDLSVADVKNKVPKQLDGEGRGKGKEKAEIDGEIDGRLREDFWQQGDRTYVAGVVDVNFTR